MSKNKKQYSNATLEKLTIVAKGAIWVGTFFALLTPLLYSQRFFFPFVSFRSLLLMGAIQVVFFAWLFLAIYYKRYRPRINAVAISLLLLVGSYILSTVAGVDAGRSFWSTFERMTGTVMILHLFGFFLATSSFFRGRHEWRKLFAVFVGVAVFAVFLDWLEQAEMIELMTDRRGSTFGNTTFYGVHLMFSGFFAIYGFFTAHNKNWKLYFGLALVPIVIGLLSSNANAAMLSFFAGAAFIGALYLVFMRQEKILRTVGVAAIVLMVVGATAAGFLLFKDGSIVNEWFIKETTRARFIVWDMAWKGFQEKPVLGWGPDNFEYVFAKHFNPCLFLSECGGEVWFDRAHNVVLNAMATRGIFGLATYALVLFVVVFVVWRHYARHRNEEDGEHTKKYAFWTAATFTALIGAYLVQNLTVFDTVNSLLVLFVVYAFVGAMVSSDKEDKETEIGKSRQGRTDKINPVFSTIVLTVIFGITFSMFVVSLAQSNTALSKVLRTNVQKPERLELAQRALAGPEVGRGQALVWMSIGVTQGVKQFSDLSSQQQQNINTNAIIAQLDFFSAELEERMQNVPFDYRAQLSLAQLYNEYTKLDPSKTERAIEASENAIKLAPNDPRARWELAIALAQAGNLRQSYQEMTRAVELQPKLLRSHLLRINVANTLGNEELLQQAVEEALAANPEWEGEIQQIIGQ